MRMNQIRTEHLFLGMLHEQETFAARTIEQRGLKISKVRAELSRNASSVNQTIARPAMGQARGLPVSLRLEDGSELTSILWMGRIAVAGEAVRLGDVVYRVLDVAWHGEHIASSPTAGEGAGIVSVSLILRRQEE